MVRSLVGASGFGLLEQRSAQADTESSLTSACLVSAVLWHWDETRVSMAGDAFGSGAGRIVLWGLRLCWGSEYGCRLQIFFEGKQMLVDGVFHVAAAEVPRGSAWRIEHS